MSHSAHPFLVVALVVALEASACREAKAPAGAVSTCDDKRRLLDCDAEIAYQGIKTEGSAHVLNLGGAQASFADTAVRQCNVQIEAYVAGQTRLCRAYNSCMGTAESYLASSQAASSRLADALAALVDTVPRAERQQALAVTDAALTRPGESPTPLSVRFSLDATLPPSAGSTTLTAPPNYPLPTKSEVSFKLHVSRPSHVYLFQVDAQNKVSVLFPDARIATKNPLPGGATVVVPEGRQTFRLDDQGLGTERVFILASARPLAGLDATLARYASGQIEELGRDPGLAELGNIDPAKTCARARNLRLVDVAPAASSAPDCVASRGFELVPAANRAAGHSLEARAASGDDVIIKVFPFTHVTEAEYAERLKEYNAQVASAGRAK